MKIQASSIFFFCLAQACLWTCLPPVIALAGQTEDVLTPLQLLAQEAELRDHLAQEISQQHLLARLKADELMAQGKFAPARQQVSQAQEMLLLRRHYIPQSVYSFLDTLGREKLASIDRQEILFLQRRLAAQQTEQVRPPIEAKVPVESAPDVTPAAAEPFSRTLPGLQPSWRVAYPSGQGLQTLIAQVDYEVVPLAEVLDDLRSRSGVNIVANWPSLNNLGIDRNTTVSLQLQNVSAGQVLKTVLQNLSSSWGTASYVIQDEVVMVAGAEDLARIVETRSYDITHLLMETKDKRGGTRFAAGSGQAADRIGGNRTGNLSDRYTRNANRSRNSADRYRSTSRVGVSQSSGSSTPAASEAADRKQTIIDLVRSSAPEESWRENGGPGTLSVFGTRLVVTQTVENHAKIAQTIALLGW